MCGRSRNLRAKIPIASTGSRAHHAQKDPDTVALEKRVSDVLGLTVSVDHRGDNGGTVHIKYRDLDQLDEIMKRLARGN